MSCRVRLSLHNFKMLENNFVVLLGLWAVRGADWVQAALFSPHLIPVITLVQGYLCVSVAEGDDEGEEVTPETVDTAQG